MERENLNLGLVHCSFGAMKLGNIKYPPKYKKKWQLYEKQIYLSIDLKIQPLKEKEKSCNKEMSVFV